MTKLKILFWHDTPIQVRAEGKEGRAVVQQSARFQAAIDEAAMAANLIGADEYTKGFQWREADAREGSAQDVAQAVAPELESRYDQIDWQSKARRLKRDRIKLT